MIGVDTGFFTELKNDNPRAKEVWDMVVKGEEEMMISVVSINEVLVHFFRKGKPEKQDKTTEVLGSKIDNLTEETKQDFTNLRQDYGKIYQTTEKIPESMDNTSKKTEKVLEVLTQQQKEFTDAINGLTKAILALAEKRT